MGDERILSLKKEAYELNVKRSKLFMFINSADGEFSKLSAEDQELLFKQHEAMTNYFNILDDLICRANQDK